MSVCQHVRALTPDIPPSAPDDNCDTGSVIASSHTSYLANILVLPVYAFYYDDVGYDCRSGSTNMPVCCIIITNRTSGKVRDVCGQREGR
jgi:hypothetical protein